MRTLSPLVAAFIALSGSIAVGDTDDLGDPLRLSAVVAYVREHNPEIRAARSRAEVAAFMPAQVRALDDPTVSHEAWNMPNSFRMDRADNNIFRISQKLPFPGKRRLAGAVAERCSRQ